MTQVHTWSAMTDTDLVILVQQADTSSEKDAAFERLEHRFKARFEGLLRRHPVLLRDAENVRQELRIALWKAAGRFDPGRGVSFATYVMHDIRGALVRGYKQITNRREISDESRDRAHEPNRDVEAKLLQDALMGRLSPREATVASYLVDEFSISDIAAELALAKSTVCETLGRIRAKAQRMGMVPA